MQAPIRVALRGVRTSAGTASTPTRTLFALTILCAATPLLTGCGEPPTAGEVAPIARLIEDDPSAVFSQDNLIDSEPVITWGRDDCLVREGWRSNLNDDEATCFADALRLQPTKQWVTLTLDAGIDAAEFDAVDIVAHGLARQRVGIQWTSGDESFDDRRRVEGSIRANPQGGAGSARLRLRGREGWQGPIGRIRLFFVVPNHAVARIEGITAVRERVNSDRLARAAERPWKIEIGDDLRNGIVGLPQQPIRWSAQAAPASRLFFTYGILGFCRDGFVFEVKNRDGLSRRTLFSQSLDCSSPGWHEASVPVPSAGAHTFEFVSRPIGEFSPTTTLPVWANIELVRPEPAEQPNIILISVDTLRADHLSLYGYDRETSPRLDARAGSGSVVFERVVAPSPWTLPSHTSIFTGIDAHHHGVNHGAGMPDSLLTMAESLRAAGYSTRAVTAGGFVHQQYGFAQGFDVYTSMSMRMGFENELEVGAERARDALERVQGRRFFLFFHTYEVHNPFRPRQPHLEEISGRTGDEIVDVDVLRPRPEDGFLARRELKVLGGNQEVARTREQIHALAVDLYDSSIAYADRKIDELLSSIDELDLAGTTVVILTSDHGELFGEHGLVNHISLYDENVMVPLVVIDPRLGEGVRRVSKMVRSVDLYPTVLELAGVPVPDGIDGRSLAPLISDRRAAAPVPEAWSYAANSNYGISVRRDDGSTYIARNDAWLSDGPREEFFGAVVGPTDAAAASFRAVVESELAGAQPGLRIRCRNTTKRPFAVAMRGSLVQPARLKLATVSDGVVRREADGSAVLEVPPGMDLTVVVEGLHFESIHLSVTADGGVSPVHDLEITRDDLSRTLWLGESGGEPVVKPVDAVKGSGVFLWLEGGDAGEQIPVDDEILEQLEALGYAH